MKKVPSSKSSAQLKAISAETIPFKPTGEIDATKLGALWASSTDALNTVGDGFENVIEAINALIDDNQESRKDNKRTRQVVYLGLFGMLSLGATALYFSPSVFG